MSRGALTRMALLTVSLLMGACSLEADPLPQLLLVIDTDAPTTAQAFADEALSGNAAVDTLRLDFIARGQPYASATFSAPETSDWPLSLAVRAPAELAGQPIRVSVRAFRSSLASAEAILTGPLGGSTELRPPDAATIHRIVELDLPSEGVVYKRVLLSLECFGYPPNFVSPARSCVDAARPEAHATEGILDSADEPSVVGSSPLARAVPCRGSPAADRVCIPGGFVVLGDPELVGIADITRGDSMPFRPALVKPFWIDRTEQSVGVVHGLLDQLVGAPPTVRGTGNALSCTWLGPNVHDQDALPINCIEWATAREICEAQGGDLPSEAQWEHAASGRGQSRRAPWGDEPAECCSASLDRTFACRELGISPEPVGSHPRQGCEGPGDVSRDGVLDLGGSMGEWMRDTFRDYGADDECWDYEGIAGHDFVCGGGGAEHSVRGGSWASGLGTARSALRGHDFDGRATIGLRCAYEDGDASP